MTQSKTSIPTNIQKWYVPTSVESALRTGWLHRCDPPPGTRGAPPRCVWKMRRRGPGAVASGQSPTTSCLMPGWRDSGGKSRWDCFRWWSRSTVGTEWMRWLAWCRLVPFAAVRLRSMDGRTGNPGSTYTGLKTPQKKVRYVTMTMQKKPRTNIEF